MTNILKKSLSALIVTSMIASSSMAAVMVSDMDIQNPRHTMHLEPLKDMEMPKNPSTIILDKATEEKKKKPTFKEEALEAAAKAALAAGKETLNQINNPDKDDVVDAKRKALNATGAIAKAGGKEALKLITFDHVMDGVGLVAAAVFGPEALMVTESIKKVNKALNEIPIVKDVKAKVTKFVATAVKDGITIASKKTYGWVSNKISGWFGKKKTTITDAAPAA